MIKDHWDDARTRLDRVRAESLAAEVGVGALVVDIRPATQRQQDGELDGAIVIDRNVLEWRLTPTSPWRIPELTGPDLRVVLACNEGFASVLCAVTLLGLGLPDVTDLEGGYQALIVTGSPLVDGEPAVDRSVWSPDWLS